MSEQLHHLSIDLETYSTVSIGAAGSYRYILDPSFEILLFAYSLDGMPVEVIDVASGQVIPLWLKNALKNPLYIKHAYNAAFEWFALSKYLGWLPPDQWRDTMLHALYCGYPASLDAAGRAMGLPEDKKKLTTGKALIRYFCVPCKPSNANGNRTRNLPKHDPAKWKLFKEYNGQDVVTEMEIDRRLSAFPVPAFVQKQWETDLTMNARGVAADMEMVSGALVIGATVKSQLMAEARQLSGLDNPNSIKQLARWLTEATDGDTEITSVTKETVATMLKQPQPANVQRMLEIRQELGKTSTKKYDALETCIADDGRVRGLLQFYGANRTGRWAGRLVQVQNLPRTYTHPLPPARQLVKDRNIDGLRLMYGSINDTLSQLIRTAFVATPGNVLIDADFSAIEARVISWLAGQEWRLEVFRTHGKIYEASASQMFHVPIEKIKKGNPEYALRQRGKVAELALGYQGGVSAMRRMDTGHNLDDEIARLFSNTLRWDVGYLSDQGPRLDGEDGFARKVKPFWRLTEFETATYAFLEEIEHHHTPCPYSAGASFTYYKGLWNQLEEEMPGRKLSFYVDFLKRGRSAFAGLERTEGDALAPCTVCGYPTSSGVCGVCRIREVVKEGKE